MDKITPTGWPLDAYVSGCCRIPSDPPGEFPGHFGAYIDVFSGLSVREVPPGDAAGEPGRG